MFGNRLSVGSVVAYGVGQGEVTYGLVVAIAPQPTPRPGWSHEYGIRKFRNECLTDRFQHTVLRRTDACVLIHPEHYNERLQILAATLEGAPS